jgi:acetyl esterase/lipase
MNCKKLGQAKQKFLLFLLLISCVCYGQQKIIRLYQGKTPGSENWNWREQSSDSNLWNTKIVYNVVEPSLTVFPAQGQINTGTAVIIAPGGGFYALSITNEGFEVAEWLSKKGITAFVLKYRVAHSTSEPTKEFATVMSRGKLDSVMGEVVPFATNDGLAAVAYVRKHAAEYSVNPARIGFMGFSAGGWLTMSVAYNAKDVSRPDFIAPIYALDKNFERYSVPKERMSAFIAVASDDGFGLAPASIAIYNKWTAAKQSAELHIYQSGGHGFGMHKQNIPTDTWIERFGDWLKSNKLL